ncbi:MAG: hemin ABC transporter substrate-binding protein [Gammaproteobacteria bacterium]
MYKSASRLPRRRAARLAVLFFAPLLLVLPRAQAEPTRVLTLGGAITEIVYALDAGASIVATDISSTWPEAARALPKVGYFRTLTIEPLLALSPDLILASEHAGPHDVLERIAAAGVRVVRVPDAPSASGIVAKIDTIATALNRVEAGKALAARVETSLADARRRLPAPASSPGVVFLLSAGPQGLMAAGKDTAADALIALLGAHNLFADHHGYAPVSAEALAGHPPKFVLVSARSLTALGGPDAVLALPGLATSGLDAQHVIAVDDLAVLGFGPRLPAGLVEIASRMDSAR